MIAIRREAPTDFPVVFEVARRAFGQPDEAKLVEALRGPSDPQVSRVAVEGDRVVGHVFFSPVSIESPDAGWTAIGLAPLAVDPDYQNRGIGSALARAGLEACRDLGEPIVFVLGHPDYYPRFGFRPARPDGLSFRDDPRSDRSFMVIELVPGALRGRSGRVRYRPEFYTED